MHDANTVVTKTGDTESKVPIQIPFPFRYNNKCKTLLDSLDYSGKVLTEERVEYGSNLPLQECRFCAFSFNSHKLSKLPFS